MVLKGASYVPKNVFVRARNPLEFRFGLGHSATQICSPLAIVQIRPIVFVLKHGRPQRGGHCSRQEMSRAMARGASGPEAFTLLLRLLMTHFDEFDTEEDYMEWHSFGMCNGTPFSEFSREFRVLVPTATGS